LSAEIHRIKALSLQTYQNTAYLSFTLPVNHYVTYSIVFFYL